MVFTFHWEPVFFSRSPTDLHLSSAVFSFSCPFFFCFFSRANESFFVLCSYLLVNATGFYRNLSVSCSFTSKALRINITLLKYRFFRAHIEAFFPKWFRFVAGLDSESVDLSFFRITKFCRFIRHLSLMGPASCPMTFDL